MPKSKIIKEIVNDQISLEQALLRLMVLAKDVGDKELEKWAEKEINGYDKKDSIPNYRKAQCSNIRYSGLNGNFQVTNIPLPVAFIGEDFYKHASKVEVLDGINTVNQFAHSDKTITKDLTILAGNISNATNEEVICTSIEQVIPKSIFQDVCTYVKQRIINELYELEKQFGNLDDLCIETTKNMFQAEDASNNTVNIRVPFQAEKEAWYSKIGWRIIIPTITAVAGALIAAFFINYLGL